MKLSIKQEEEILRLRKRAFSYRSISDQTGVPYSTVRNLCIEKEATKADKKTNDDYSEEEEMLKEIFSESEESKAEIKSERVIPAQEEFQEELDTFGEFMSTGDYKVDKFIEISKENIELYKRKNQDYGDSFGDTYKEYGNIMAVIRLQDKLQRFKQLIKADVQVKDESVIDTLRDLSNYAIMTIIELENVK